MNNKNINKKHALKKTVKNISTQILDTEATNIYEKESFFSKMSKAEKVFWGTIVLFFIIFGIIETIAIKNNPIVKTAIYKEPVTQEFIEKFFPSDIIKNNLSKNEAIINQSLNNNLKDMYSLIDREVDNLFYPVEQNIDKFLDYHYSVIGEYTELGTMAFGNIDKLVKEKLFGKDFVSRINQSSKYMQEKYHTSLMEYLSTINKYATKNVDTNINMQAMTNLQASITKHDVALSLQVVAPVGAMLGVKLAAVLASKIAAKAATKGVAKAGTKMLAKAAAAITGVAAGTMCGAFFWICSPVAAGALWVTTDIIVVSGDEYLTRDKLKKEIQKSLYDNKVKLKNSYKKVYSKSYKKFSKNVQNEYRNTPIKEKRLVKISDKF